MSQVNYSANNITLPELSSLHCNSIHRNSLSHEEMEELLYTNDLSIEEEIEYYSSKPVFGKEIHDELGAIWSNLQDWENYFERKSNLEPYIKRVRKIILKIKAENIKTSEFFFGFEVEEFLEKALQTHFKETGHHYSHQIYDLRFAFNLYFYSCLQNNSKLIVEYFDFINQIITRVLVCTKGSRYSSILNEYQVNIINNKLRKNQFKNKVKNWLSCSWYYRK